MPPDSAGGARPGHVTDSASTPQTPHPLRRERRLCGVEIQPPTRAAAPPAAARQPPPASRRPLAPTPSGDRSLPLTQPARGSHSSLSRCVEPAELCETTSGVGDAGRHGFRSGRPATPGVRLAQPATGHAVGAAPQTPRPRHRPRTLCGVNAGSVASKSSRRPPPAASCTRRRPPPAAARRRCAELCGRLVGCVSPPAEPTGAGRGLGSAA
jgi:hypothetical protein